MRGSVSLLAQNQLQPSEGEAAAGFVMTRRDKCRRGGRKHEAEDVRVGCRAYGRLYDSLVPVYEPLQPAKTPAHGENHKLLGACRGL